MDAAFFRRAYEQDVANRARQTWSEYESWIRTFYEGRTFPPVPGWSDREREMLARLPETARRELAGVLENVSRTLAAEWAKANEVRKVTTADLQAWGRRFREAARDPSALRAALAEVQEELRRRRGD